MTSVYLVRHAQPDKSWEDDRTRPLTKLGFEDSKEVSSVLSKFYIDSAYSSPYKRSITSWQRLLVTSCNGMGICYNLVSNELYRFYVLGDKYSMEAKKVIM